jgi:NADPH-dependent ferric siderophore reductase
VRIDRAIQAIAKQRAEVVREAIRIHAFALDQSRVAVRRLFRRAAAVDDDDARSAALELESRADADDARAQHEDIGARILDGHGGP